MTINSWYWEFSETKQLKRVREQEILNVLIVKPMVGKKALFLCLRNGVVCVNVENADDEYSMGCT
jgi:hypothetical protein